MPVINAKKATVTYSLRELSEIDENIGQITAALNREYENAALLSIEIKLLLSDLSRNITGQYSK